MSTEAQHNETISRIRREHSWMTRFLDRLQITRFFENDPVEEAEDYHGNWSDLVDEREAERDELRKQVELMLPVSAISKDGFPVTVGDTLHFLPTDMTKWRHGVAQDISIGKATGKMGVRIRFKIPGHPAACFEHKLVQDCYRDKGNVPEDGTEG